MIVRKNRFKSMNLKSYSLIFYLRMVVLKFDAWWLNLYKNIYLQRKFVISFSLQISLHASTENNSKVQKYHFLQGEYWSFLFQRNLWDFLFPFFLFLEKFFNLKWSKIKSIIHHQLWTSFLGDFSYVFLRKIPKKKCPKITNWYLPVIFLKSYKTIRWFVKSQYCSSNNILKRA